MPSRHGVFGWILICIGVCLLSPPAAAQARPREAPLLNLLVQARTLATEGTLEKKEAGGKMEEEADVLLTAAQVLDMLAPLGFEYNEGQRYTASSANADIRRLARLEKCNGFEAGHLLFVKTTLKNGGAMQVPTTWFMGLNFAGSGSYFQQQLVLLPGGLLDRTQARHIVDTLKASGEYRESPLSAENRQHIHAFSRNVHGLQDTHNGHRGALGEELLFNAEGTFGARIIISPEAPEKYALFILLGGLDEYEEGLCRQ